MIAVHGYYDGNEIRPLEKMDIKRNQKVIITITDEFLTPDQATRKHGMRGALSKYADPALKNKERTAWEHAAVSKHDPS